MVLSYHGTMYRIKIPVENFHMFYIYTQYMEDEESLYPTLERIVSLPADFLLWVIEIAKKLYNKFI